MQCQDARSTVLSLLKGPVREFAGDKSSAIRKVPVEGPVQLRVEGMAGDEQADRRHHGGPEKALHHYPFDHYSAWAMELGWPGSVSPDPLKRPGAFGENLSTEGLTEGDVCVGDRWRLGTALLEVSQARQPCWKLNERFGVKDMARRVQDSGRTGWYYRVLEGGVAEAGQALQLIERPHAQWPLSRILRVFYVDRFDVTALQELAELAELTESWRLLARRRVQTRCTEDWGPRLNGA